MDRYARRNALTFGPGTLGRDMVYSFVSLYLVFYVTEVVRPGDLAIWLVSGIMLVARLFDAVFDFYMGSLVERTRTRWGQFKPWIAGGAVASGVVTVLLFADRPHLDGLAFVATFGLAYVLWGFAWSTNDIPYWSLLPALSVEPRQRELTGSLAKVCGTLGLFAVAIGVLPVTSALTRRLGDARDAWLVLAVVLVALMWGFQVITLVGVRQPAGISRVERSSLREIWGILRRNDQVVWTAACMTLFMTGFQTTTTFGPYYFKYVWLNENLYSSFAAVAGVAQLLGYVAFPLLARRLRRRSLFTGACTLIALGYAGFFVAPRSFAWLAVVGLLIFFGQALIVMLTIVLLSDTVEYGQWKDGHRHEAITFAIQPFIYKVSAAVATALVGATAVLTGIADAPTPAAVSAEGLWGLKVMMLAVPFVLMLVAALVMRRKYRIDEAFHARIVAELRERGELGSTTS